MVEFTGWNLRFLTCLGADKKRVSMWIFQGGLDMGEGFGKRCGLEAIRGFVGLGGD